MAKSKQKDQMPAGIRNRLVAAICMLMVSCIMLVTSTYAWFTLSTAPEVKNITTTVAGNGSLEIALMPNSGLFKDIRTGYASDIAGGKEKLPVANNTWGNLISLADESYGLNKVTLYPAVLNMETPTSPLSTVKFGEDGRPAALENISKLASWDNEQLAFTDSIYGVRAIGTATDGYEDFLTYGYTVDMALRLNTTNNGTPGKLLLKTTPAQRIYNDVNSSDTLGKGSTMTVTGSNLKNLLSAIRVTFVKDYAVESVDGQTVTPTVLGTARLDTSGITDETTATVGLYMYDDATSKYKTENEAVLIEAMNKNTAYQISAIVWLDASSVKNSDLGNESFTGTLNLQFSTDVELVPAVNTKLKGASTANQ